MKRFALVIMLGALAVDPALAQQGPPPGAQSPPAANAPPAESQQDQARDAARTQAMAALSPDHQAQVTDILTKVRDGQIADPRDAAKQIDGVLGAKESAAVLAARDKMLADLRSGSGGGPGGPPGGGPGTEGGGPPGGGGFGGRHHGEGGRGMRNDAGFALLTLSLSRDQMRSLFANARPPQ